MKHFIFKTLYAIQCVVIFLHRWRCTHGCTIGSWRFKIKSDATISKNLLCSNERNNIFSFITVSKNMWITEKTIKQQQITACRPRKRPVYTTKICSTTVLGMWCDPRWWHNNNYTEMFLIWSYLQQHKSFACWCTTHSYYICVSRP
jgi:hypothetical protein